MDNPSDLLSTYAFSQCAYMVSVTEIRFGMQTVGKVQLGSEKGGSGGVCWFLATGRGNTKVSDRNSDFLFTVDKEKKMTKQHRNYIPTDTPKTLGFGVTIANRESVPQG